MYIYMIMRRRLHSLRQAAPRLLLLPLHGAAQHGAPRLAREELWVVADQDLRSADLGVFRVLAGLSRRNGEGCQAVGGVIQYDMM